VYSKKNCCGVAQRYCAGVLVGKRCRLDGAADSMVNHVTIFADCCLKIVSSDGESSLCIYFLSLQCILKCGHIVYTPQLCQPHAPIKLALCRTHDTQCLPAKLSVTVDTAIVKSMMACAVISKNNTYLTYFAFPRLSPSPVSFAPLNTFPYPHQTQQK
jgi:hypothetical protein